MDPDTFIAENTALKMKLQSKTEALKILSKELSECKKERDHLYSVLEDRSYFQHQQAQDGPKVYGVNVDDINYSGNREIQIIKDKNKLLQLEIEDLKQRLNSVQGDMKILRRDRTNARESMSVENNVSWHQREELIQELEETKAKVRHLSTDLQALLDEKEELVTERDAYRCKVHRLNHELAVVLKADSPSIDIDSLIMENKYLKDRCDQILAEKEIVIQSLRKYKAMLDKKRMKGNVRLGANTSDMVVTHKQVYELLDSDAAVWTSPYNAEATLSDLRSLCLALLDALQDKTVALTHQRRANKILAERVSNLENRLSEQKPLYPSHYLLNGYTGSQVDKHINILSIKSSISESKLTSEQTDADEEKEEVCLSGCAANNGLTENDGILPAQLQELVIKAMHEISIENSIAS